MTTNPSGWAGVHTGPPGWFCSHQAVLGTVDSGQAMAEDNPLDQPLDVVVLAGSINRIALFDGDQPGRKALVRLHGRPLISYVLDALHDAAMVGRVIVV